MKKKTLVVFFFNFVKVPKRRRFGRLNVYNRLTRKKRFKKVFFLLLNFFFKRAFICTFKKHNFIHLNLLLIGLNILIGDNYSTNKSLTRGVICSNRMTHVEQKALSYMPNGRDMAMASALIYIYIYIYI